MTTEDFNLNNLMSIRKELFSASRLLDELADVCHCQNGGECLTMARDAISQAQERLTRLESELLAVDPDRAGNGYNQKR